MLQELEALEALTHLGAHSAAGDDAVPKRFPSTPPKKAARLSPEPVRRLADTILDTLWETANQQTVAAAEPKAVEPPPWRQTQGRPPPHPSLQAPEVAAPPPLPTQPESDVGDGQAGGDAPVQLGKQSVWRSRPGHINGGRWGSRGHHSHTWWFEARAEATRQGTVSLARFYDLYGKAAGQGMGAPKAAPPKEASPPKASCAPACGGYAPPTAKARLSPPPPPPPPPPPRRQARPDALQ